MFNANDARRYPGFFTRTWTPPPDGFSLRNARSRRSGCATFAHATPPPLTPRLATPIGVRGLAATDNLERLGLSQALPEDVPGSRALVGMSREEPDISPHISTLDVGGSGRFTATHASRHGWEDMPQGERMDYAARLEDDVAQMQNALDRAYHLRDHYKEEAARVKNELMQKQRALDCLERDHRQCGEVICRHEREAADLRHRLDCAEGEVQRLKYLQRSEDPNVRVPLLDAQRELRLKQTEVDSLLEEKRQLEEHVRRLTLERSGEHYAARVHEGAVTRPPSVAHVEEGGEELTRARHVIQVLRTELQDMRQQLQNERSRNEGTLDEVIQQRNGLQGVNTSLREELEGLKEMCCSQNRTIDELRDTLLQRAPVTHHEHYALVRRCEKLKEEIERCQTRGGDSVNKAHELEKQAIQQQLLALRADGEETNTLLLKTRADVADMREYISTLETELDLTRKNKTLLEEELAAAKEKLQYATEQNNAAEQVIVNFNRRLQDQFSTIQVQKAQLDFLQQEATRASMAITPSKAAPVDSRPEGRNGDKETKNGMPPETPGIAEKTMAKQHNEAQAVRETFQAVPEENAKSQDEDRGKTHKTEGELPQFPPRLSAGNAAIDQLSAERSAQAERVAELTAAVARLESSADAPERVVEALSAELRETQDRLRQAEEEAGQLAERIGSSEGLCESAVATRSAETSLAAQLSSALKTLEQLAEERETLARGSAELEERVRELEQELRDAQTAHDVDSSDGLTLREQLAAAHAAIDQLSAERSAQAERVAELTAAVARLESSADVPERVVEALSAELRETQDRLRQAEEEASQLAERIGSSEGLCESAVATRSAETSLAAQLSSALKTLEQLAEERETLARSSAELEERVRELEQELRDAQTAHDVDSSDGLTLREQLAAAHAAIDQLSAERSAQAERVAELTAAVARLESSADVPERVVEALSAELRETQDRLRQAEEEASQLAERIGSSEGLCESAVATRSAETSLAAQLSSALKALEQLAEERETLARGSAELEERVRELEQELRDAQTAHDVDSSDGLTLREQLAAAHAAIDQLSAERSAQAERVAELTAAVARLESSADVPERVVEALSAELRETQDRLRQAEEEASQLAERIGSSEGLCESAVATRSAETSLAVRLSSALKALEQLAEERETLARSSAELEERVRELEQELRDAQTAHDVDSSDGLTLREQLAAAHAAIDQLSAERSAQAERVAELTAAVARLESSADVPERVVEALSAELRETQDRLRQAEEEASQLAERIGSSEGLRESAVATRSAETSLAVRLSSALKALEQLAEERETLARGSAELEERVRELEQELRDAQTAHDVDSSDGLTLREQLAAAHAAIDQLSAERSAQAERVAELTAAVARLESSADAPERVVEALSAELRETQDRLRQAEEEAGQLAERIGSSEGLRESAVATRSAETSLAVRLSSALKALEQLAEERETLARGSAELEERVRELEQELRDAQTAHDVDSSDGLTLREQLAAAHAAIDQLSAERSAQAERVAELTAAVARLESSADAPERVVEALSAELRETQDRLRQAEEEASQLAERIGSSEGLRESAVATRSAETSLAVRLSSALKALEQLAEERETLARGSAELEERVRELEQELRDAQTAHDVDSSDGLTLREQLAAAHAAIDQLSAERSAQAERVAELTAAVARMESSADAPERVVEALSAELRETQDRLRQAEEEASQLAERIGSSEGLCESAVATRSAETSLAVRLSSALKALEQLAEERETLARSSAELEERVRELEQELRDAQTAHDVDSSDGLTLREQLAAAHAAIDQLSAERSAQAERVAELTAAVARLESSADVPERVVEALSAELRETQDRLRQAEEEAGQLAERIGSSEGLCESAVATRSAETSLAVRLSSALKALEQLAEERETLARGSAELEERVRELEQELRDAQTAHDVDSSDGLTLREQLAAAHAAIDQLSAERSAQAERVAELTAAVARLESSADAPERVVEALSAELRETQDRLRQAEEEASQLAERIGSSEGLRESAVATRSAETSLAVRLSSALKALEQLAEERETLARGSAELEERVRELEQELRDAQTAHDVDSSDGLTLREQLAAAHAAIDQLSAERSAQAERVAELTAAVARMESSADAPERVVEALSAELRETQDRLRQAEEEASQLAERIGSSEGLCESAVATRSAETSLAVRLSSALKALEQLAEERETLARGSAELEERVRELEQELRDAQTAHDVDSSDGLTLREQLAAAHAAIDQLSAERSAQAERVAELTAAVARLESSADVPERVVEALSAELRETQDRLRQAEEEAGQLAERIGSSEGLCESAVATRSAETSLAVRLSSALKALEQLAEERETLARGSAELEERVRELEQELRDAQTAHDVDSSDGLTLREQLAAAHAAIDQLSAERSAQAERVAELTAAVARLESSADVPERVVEALSAELRETQDRLRQAEEEAGQLAERIGSSEGLCESAVATRSAETSLAVRLSSALKALEQLAEERETLARGSAELEERVRELEQELRDAQTAHDVDSSDGLTLREQLAAAHAAIDQLSAERSAQAERVAELTAAVARLESSADVPERVVEALSAELRETQDRLRQAEEEAGQLAERIGSSEGLCESAVATRSAETSLAVRLSSALKALEQLAEERETLARGSAELEERVRELEQELRDAENSLCVKECELLKLGEECSAKSTLLSNALAAVDQVVQEHTSAETSFEEQKSSLVKTFEVLHGQFLLTKKGFEEQWERRAEACTAELLAARRSAQRANEARKRAEENAAICMRKVEEVNAELMKAQRDYRALERLMRSSGRLSTSRVENNDGEEHEREMSFTPTFLRNTEGAELAQFLQISSLQADLMLSRSTCHRLEARQLELQTALEQSEWRLTSLPPGVEESHAELLRVRGQLENNQLEYHRLEGRYKALKRQRAEEVEQLQRQNERLVQQLREKRDKIGSLSRQMRDSEVAAKQQAEELAQAFNLLETQMQALREEVEGGQPRGRQARRPGRRQGVETTEAEGKMLRGRVTILEHTLRQKETEMHRLQEELGRNEAQLDQFEDQVTVATQRLENTARRSTHLEQKVHELKRTNQELRDELGAVRARVAVQVERRSPQRAPSTDVLREALHGGRASSLASTSTQGEREGRAASALPRAAAKRPRAIDASS